MRRPETLIKMLQERADQRRCDRQSGSITALTLIGLGAILGAFLYVAVVGGRAADTIRVRTSADAAALAAATIKARSLNYTSFLLEAETILLPLLDVAQNIATVQSQNSDYAVCAMIALANNNQIGITPQACLNHVLATAPNAYRENLVISDLINALSQTAAGLNTIGPLWAESVAVQTAESSAYTSGNRPIDRVGIFPALTSDPMCAGLGLTQVSATTPSAPGHKGACDTENAWELAYVAMSNDLTLAGIDSWAWNALQGDTSCAQVPQPAKSLCDMANQYPDLLKAGGPTGELQKVFTNAQLNNYFQLRKSFLKQVGTIPSSQLAGKGPNKSCSSPVQVPALGPDWSSYITSIAMTMSSQSSDSVFVPRLESLRRGAKGTLPTGSPLGIACAQHYSTDPSGSPGLWSMTWRARLVPCNFTNPDKVRLVTSCGGQTGIIGERFQKELALGIAADWRW